jgi:hypothetical protein
LGKGGRTAAGGGNPVGSVGASVASEVIVVL